MPLFRDELPAGREIDVLVGYRLGLKMAYKNSTPYCINSMGTLLAWRPSSHWSQGGSIVETYRIQLRDVGGQYWMAQFLGETRTAPTALLAAMRVFVGVTQDSFTETFGGPAGATTQKV